MRVPLVDLALQHAAIRDEVMAAAREVIERQAFIGGEPVARFEATLARIVGTPHAVGVASGSDALVLALRAVGIGPGDVVVTTPLTFVATAEAIVAVGARPLFADVDAETLTLDPQSVEERVRQARAAGARVRGVLPVHLFGQCADMRAILETARAHDLLVVEDAAQAIGARDEVGVAGAMGDAGCFSFFPAKNLGGWGDGGAVVTNDRRVADRVRRLAAHGIGPELDPDAHDEIGYNSRLDALQAAVLDVKARHLGAWTRARRAVAERYRTLLADVPGLTLPRERPGTTHVYHQFVVRLATRDGLAKHLATSGVRSRVYYARPLHQQPAYAPFAGDVSLPNAEAASRSLLALPMYPELDAAQQEHVAGVVRSWVAGDPRAA